MSGSMIKTDLRRLFTGTAVYGLGGMLQQLVGFLLLPVFTAYLATADYGVIGILSVVGFLLTPIFQMGIGVSTGVVYFRQRRCPAPKPGHLDCAVYAADRRRWAGGGGGGF